MTPKGNEDPEMEALASRVTSETTSSLYTSFLIGKQKSSLLLKESRNPQ